MLGLSSDGKVHLQLEESVDFPLEEEKRVEEDELPDTICIMKTEISQCCWDNLGRLPGGGSPPAEWRDGVS